MALTWKQHSVLPGFGLTLGFAVLYLGLVVLIPLAGLVAKVHSLTWGQFWATVTEPRVLAAYRMSFGGSLAGAAVNSVFGLIVAWVLVRYRFVGRRIVDALVDLPFALPTAVSGIALTSVYAADGWIGRWLDRIGIHVTYTPLGVIVAMVFIGLPFVVRTLQPALTEIDGEIEDAAASLGANRWRTFWRVILPSIVPALLTGFALAFARGVGEYGSIIFISGNLPMRTEIAPLLVVSKLEQYDPAGASAIAVVMLTASFLVLLSINLLQWWNRRRYGA
jgi:sulfate/thiosulfate transport system permease protein